MRTIPFKIALSLAATTALSSPALAGTIDISPGQSINAALAAAKSGDTVRLEDGTYNEQVVIGNEGVTLTAANPLGATIEHSGPGAIVRADANGVVISNIKVTGDTPVGIYYQGSDGAVTGNEVYGTSKTVDNINGGAGIDIAGENYESKNVDVKNNLVHGIGSPGSQITHGIYAAYKDGEITGNTVSDISGAGIHAWHAASDLTIDGNTVSNTGHSNIVVGAGDGPSPYIAEGFVVTNNRLDEGVSITNDGVSRVGKVVSSNNTATTSVSNSSNGGLATGDATLDRYDSLFDDADVQDVERIRKMPIDEWDNHENCSEATYEEKVAFCTAAGQPESCNLDFKTKCEVGETEEKVNEEEIHEALSIDSENKQTSSWQDNGSKSFNKNEPWGSGECTGGYGDACMDPDNVRDVSDFIVLDGKPCTGEERAYCGAEINTRGIADIIHGTVEVKAIVDEASGSFHAPGWLMGNGTGANGWPKTGEIDFAEGAGTDGKMYLTVHWGGEGCPGGHCSISKPGVKVDASQLNTYAVRRSAGEIVQIVNGQETARITRSEVTAKGGDGGVLFDDSMHFRADKAAGGPWAAPNGEKLEAGAVRIQKGSVKFSEG